MHANNATIERLPFVLRDFFLFFIICCVRIVGVGLIIHFLLYAGLGFYQLWMGFIFFYLRHY